MNAINKGINVDLLTALNKFQIAMDDSPISKNAQGYNYRYADLATILDAIRKPLADADLVVVQLLENDADLVPIVITRLYHVSGQYVESSLAIKPNKQDAQGCGSSITYARRYSVLAILNLAPEDDDGAEASKPRKNRADIEKIKEHNNKVAEAEQMNMNVYDLYAKSDITKKALDGLIKQLSDRWEAIDV
tara:strand:+ start:3607 stop:4179 length:573 start_codon:yes stop_codon:yes gene_type:complete